MHRLFVLALFTSSAFFLHAQEDSTSKTKKVKKILIAEIPAEDATAKKINVLEAKWKNCVLELRVKYPGGCKAHSFDLYTQATKDSAGVYQAVLIDHTQDDMCKAFKFTTLYFDLKTLTKKAAKVYQLHIEPGTNTLSISTKKKN